VARDAYRNAYRIGRGWGASSRGAAFGIVAAVYLVAAAVGWLVAEVFSARHPIEAFFYADIAATVVVFAASMALANSSVYDSYWSVAPPLIAVGWVLEAGGGLTARRVIVLVLLTVWAVRLTANWATGWTGLAHEDWRYVQIREQSSGHLPWWLVSFTGIHLMPTLVVFLALLPAWPALNGYPHMGFIDLLAIAVMAFAILTEAVADRQLRRFAAQPGNAGRSVDIGLWRWSRHPNYLGEIGVWWGLWLFGLAADPSWWWTVIGPLAMVGLFAGVSIPLMERRCLERRPDYRSYQRDVPVLVPWRPPGRRRYA
jgi:steroid 5-alpha reductase family enzyme